MLRMFQTIRLWDFNKGQCITVLRDHQHVVECVAFCPQQALGTLHDEVEHYSMPAPQPQITSHSPTRPHKSPCWQAPTYCTHGLPPHTTCDASVASPDLTPSTLRARFHQLVCTHSNPARRFQSRLVCVVNTRNLTSFRNPMQKLDANQWLRFFLLQAPETRQSKFGICQLISVS